MVKRRKVVIAFVGVKGGIGKSTLAIACGCEWSRRGLRVVILDLDVEQRASTKFYRNAEEHEVEGGPMVVPMTKENFKIEFEATARNYDVVVIDLPGTIDRTAAVAMGFSHLVVLPCGPAPIEVEAMGETMSKVGDALELRPDIDAVIVLCKLQRGTTIARQLRESFSEAQIAVAKTDLTLLVNYSECYALGLGPTTYDLKSVASEEIQALCSELDGRLQRKNRSAKRAV